MLTHSFGPQTLEAQLKHLGVLKAYHANLDRAASYAAEMAEDGLPPFARQKEDGADMSALIAAADKIASNFKDLIVLGTGGSSLGAQAAIAIARYRNGRGVRLHLPDSLDPYEMDMLFSAIRPEECHVVAISKSGTTGETLAQLLLCRDWIERSASVKAIKDHFTFITEPGERTLREYGDLLGSDILDHATDVGGRFSVLSNVGMLPVAVAGLSPVKFRRGAADICETFCNAPRSAIATVGAALMHTLNTEKSINQTVIMPYIDSLRAFTRWHGQLWAESLGKDGMGTTPVRAVGPVDQHSQLQLFLDGPNDKFFTIITVPGFDKGPRIDARAAQKYGLDYMAGRTIGDIVSCQSRATEDTLRAKGRTVREITIDVLSEENIGGLFVSYMLETVIAAHLMGVDAYDQPAVEEGKILTRKYLAELNT